MLRFACALVLLAACGPGTSTVTVAGNKLTPKSSVMSDFASIRLNGLAVYVSDQADVCASVGASDPCNAIGALPFSTVPAGSGLLMMLVVGGTQKKAYEVGPVSPSRLPSGLFRFYKLEDGVGTLVAEGESGSITLEEYGSTSASGKYEVTLKGGGEVKGTFAAERCAALKEKNQFSGNRVCAIAPSDGGVESCLRECSCANRTVRSSCVRDTANGPWSCSCSGGGAETTCSGGASLTAVEACQETAGCCPMRF